MQLHDTIVAPATAPGMGALAVIRLSGTQALQIAERAFKGPDLKAVSSHTVHYGHITDAEGKALDEVMASVFHAPRSFTTEDTVEISCHGSPYVVEQIVTRLVELGARHAEPGEFTLRAFMNGRINLTQAEAVADLIASENEAQHQLAIHQVKEGYWTKLSEHRQKLLDLAALLELELDFVEEDVEFAQRDELQERLQLLSSQLQVLEESYKWGNVIKKGVPVALAGPPNAGKSTLLNALLQEEKAIVSPIAGTTRDFIEGELNLGGVKFRFVDTAGLRETSDEIESIGVERSRQKMGEAHFILFLFDTHGTNIDQLEEYKTLLSEQDKPVIWLANKVELSSKNHQEAIGQALKGEDFVFFSALEEVGVHQVREALLNRAGVDKIRKQDEVVTNLRQFETIKQGRQAVADTLDAIENGLPNDLIAFELRQCLEPIGKLTGEITNDEVLGNIFSKFCIGK